MPRKSRPRRPASRRPQPPRDELAARVARTAPEPRDAEDADERDATVAMVVVRALDRARELAGVEGSGLALRRALRAAEKPLAAYLERHLAKRRSARRRKA